MEIIYRSDAPVSAAQFAEVLKHSTLGERRPVDNESCLQGMLDHSDLLVTAWAGDQLVGIARSVTDFHFCCYLSDLAVDQTYQRFGIGKQLQSKTQEHLGPECMLILLAAPAADSYYGHVGYSRHERCWVLQREQTIGGG